MPNNLIAGDDGINNIAGTADSDLIYGFNPAGPQGTVSSITATRVATGFSQPIYATAPPGDLDRLFVVEKTGQIKIFNLNTQQVLPTTFLDLTTQILADGEGGLLGLAFHPDYAINRTFFVYLINTSGDTEIRRYQAVAGDPDHASPNGTLVLSIDQPNFSNHKAGWLDFGSDGYLYIAVGDGGGGGDPLETGQNANDLLGNILRIDVDGDAFPGDPMRNYAVPADNPFVGVAGADEVWALGLRNPWRNSFDRGLGDLYIADVGQNMWEEINIGQSGANYGWDVREGPNAYEPGPLGPGNLTDPIYSYNHSIPPAGGSVTGGYVYRGERDGLQGHYFFADFVDNKVYSLWFDGAQWVATDRTAQIDPDVGTIANITSFGEDGRGNLYLVTFGGGIFRLSPDVVSADLGDNLGGAAGDDILYGGTGNDLLNGVPAMTFSTAVSASTARISPGSAPPTRSPR